jgi:glycine cleavage system regulatory protein
MIDWAGVATVITAATSGVVSLVTLYRVGHVKTDVADVKKNVDVVVAHTNGMVDKLAQLAEAKGAAIGKLEGRAEVRAENKVNGDKLG